MNTSHIDPPAVVPATAGRGAPAAVPRAPRPGAGAARRLFAVREAGVLAALVVLCVALSFASPYFFTLRNIFNVLQGMSTIGIMAIGMTIVLVAGGLDLSVGSILAVGAVLTARLMTYGGVNPWLAVLGGLGAGLAFGLVNGVLVTRAGIVPFIATLGTLSVGRGLTFLLASGGAGTVASNVPMRDPGVGFLGAGYIGPVPVPVVLMLVLVALAALFLRHTVLGRQIYAVGSNPRAARLSGVAVGRVQLFTYVVTGVLSALAGVVSAGLLATASTNAGEGIELDVIAAAVIGGTSLQGGEGSVVGTLFGAAIMAVVRNAFVLLGLPLHYQTMIIGAVILLAVGLDRRRR
ncbi:monosaccharide-transporting ATPase [Gemmatimonadetes bacterium T265]|nr:monosaccharide-transporting ATPase [Gemmatimonadetes bacterium T265]